MLVTLVAALSCPAPAATCSVCNLHLTARKGTFQIKLFKEAMNPATDAPSFRIAIVNTSPRPLVLGRTATSSPVVLNFVTPAIRGKETIYRIPAGRTRSVAPGSTLTFHATYPYRLGRPGVYTCNVSVGHVDSNVLTYVVR